MWKFKKKTIFSHELKNTKASYGYQLMIWKDSVKIFRNKFVKILNIRNIDCRVAKPRISKMPMFKENKFNISSNDRG